MAFEAAQDVRSLKPGGMFCGFLQLGSMLPPPGRVDGGHVVVAVDQADDTVDELAQEVRVPCVPVSLGNDVGQNLMQVDDPVVLGPPRHRAFGGEVETPCHGALPPEIRIKPVSTRGTADNLWAT